MRIFRPIASICTILVSLAGAGNSFANAPSCTFLLDDNSYQCQVVSETGATSQECFTFNSSASNLSSKFDLFALGETLGCSCEVDGSFSSLKFNVSKKFLCTNQNGLVIGGKVTRPVKGKGKIKIGQIIRQNGDSADYVCLQAPGCP